MNNALSMHRGGEHGSSNANKVKRKMVIRTPRKRNSQYLSNLKKLASPCVKKLSPSRNQSNNSSGKRANRNDRNVTQVPAPLTIPPVEALVKRRPSVIDHAGQPIEVQLLSDMHGIFNARDVPKLRIKSILADLCVDSDNPWATFCDGRGISARRLNSILHGLMHSVDIRFNDGVFKGFSRKTIDDAWSCYQKKLSV